MPVSFQEILDAFEFVSASAHGEHQAYLCRQTGKIYVHSDLYEDPDEELPEDIENEEKYTAFPDKRDLDLGKPLILDFAREFLPKDFDRVRAIFSKKGAYSRFKHLLARTDMLKQWYDFEAKATERALRDWCELNEIDVSG